MTNLILILEMGIFHMNIHLKKNQDVNLKIFLKNIWKI